MAFIRFYRGALMAVLFVLAVLDVEADGAHMARDVTVGPPDHPVALKAGTAVKVLSASGTKDVISVDLPDGSSGIYQVDAAAVKVSASTAPVAASAVTAPPETAAPPAITNTPAAANSPASAPAAANAPAAPTPTAPPDFDHSLVGGPEFHTTAGTQSAGTACLAKLKDLDLCFILTARHLLGPNGGFAKETQLNEVPDFVKGIDFNAFDGSDHNYATKGLLVQSDPADKTGLWNDIAIFQVTDGPDKPLLIADKPPAVGDPVWIVAHVRGGVPEGEIMHRAVVSVVDPNFICAIFDNDHIVTAGASGAPVLNAAGEVVGVYSGHFNKDGHVGANIISAQRVAQDIKDAQ